MAQSYIIQFADLTKSSFIVSPYSADGPKSSSDSTFINHAVRASTTLKLYGKGTPEYGEGFEQNLVYMLENFANSTDPVYSIEGQLWYMNGVGSPASAGELFIRNKVSTGTVADKWDAVLLATGSSVMTGLLTLSGDPTAALHAATKQYVDNTAVSITGDTMTGLLTLSGDPTSALHAATKQYVDSQIISGAGGDGYLSSTAWLPGVGTVGSISDNILQFTITYPGGSTSTLTADGISRVGHTHTATEVSFDTTSLTSYPTDVQLAIEYADSIKAPVANPSFTGSVTLPRDPVTSNEAATKGYVDNAVLSGTSSGLTAEREMQLTVGGSPAQAVYSVPIYAAAGNKLFVYINGIKQFGHTYNGQQPVLYDSNATTIESTTITGMDESIDYHFNVTIDGVGPTLITIIAGTVLLTHADLVNAINSALTAAGIGATYSIVDFSTERFLSNISGNSANVLIEAPVGGSPATYNYLFQVPAPITIVRPEFVGVFTDPNPSNWTVPDQLILFGDVTASFPAGKTFTVRGSSTDYGSYDSVYSVYSTGSVYNSGTNETTVPVASVSNFTQPEPLLSALLYAGSPVPVPVISSTGDMYLTYIGGLTGLGTSTYGMDGDYREISYVASPATIITAQPGTYTTSIEFNYSVSTGLRLEATVLN